MPTLFECIVLTVFVHPHPVCCQCRMYYSPPLMMMLWTYDIT